MAEFELKSSQFRREREESWGELERLIDRVERSGARTLSPDELSRLPVLYRSTISSLSVARAISLDKNLLDYLESLVGRAYLSVYSSKRAPLDAVLRFALYSFPVTVRRNWGYLVASSSILLIGVLCGWLLTLQDLEWYYSFVPAELVQERTPASSTESLREMLYDQPGESGPLGALNVFASFLFTHNAKIGILCFALGFAAGVPTAFLLFYNGLSLGAIAALYQSRDLGAEFWAWVLPHGVTELGAVCLCGMAGLALGMAVVFPGPFARLENLARRGREMVMVLIGAVVMDFIAAMIEGFFRQLVHDISVRWTVAGVSLVFWVGYFGLMGRSHEHDSDR